MKSVCVQGGVRESVKGLTSWFFSKMKCAIKLKAYVGKL